MSYTKTYSTTQLIVFSLFISQNQSYVIKFYFIKAANENKKEI